MVQICEITANTKRGARGFILPPKTKIGNPAENTLPPDTAAEIKNLDITLKEIVLDGGFMPTPSNTALENLTDTIHITGRQERGSRRTRRRRQRYRTGAEGRISHLKRGYRLDRSRLKGDTGHQIWAGDGLPSRYDHHRLPELRKAGNRVGPGSRLGVSALLLECKSEAAGSSMPTPTRSPTKRAPPCPW